MTRPSLRLEKSLLRQGHTWVAGVDEVGRGALCGPVSVGVVMVGVGVGRVPQGLADSKLLTPDQRERLAPVVRRWAPWHAVGHAGADEVDACGILAALRLAAVRAFEMLASVAPTPDIAVLDGSHDWLTWRPSQGDLFDESPPEPEVSIPHVITRVKADLSCASVAAASVLAKTERDAFMTRLSREYPAFGWDSNKGYAAPDHVRALEEVGPTPWHRRSWRLPGLGHGEHGDDQRPVGSDRLGTVRAVTEETA